jgi:hypothetical protein
LELPSGLERQWDSASVMALLLDSAKAWGWKSEWQWESPSEKV